MGRFRWRPPETLLRRKATLYGLREDRFYVDSNTPMEVAPDGTVKQGGVGLGKLDLADFPPGSLTKQGVSLFRPIEGAKPLRRAGFRCIKASWKVQTLPAPSRPCAWSVSCDSLKCCRRRSASAQR